MTKINKLISVFVDCLFFIMLILSLCVLVDKLRQNQPTQNTIIQIDTVYKYDTIRIMEPKYITKEIVRVDTVHLIDVYKDTVYVTLPIERKTYVDSLYRIVVSGYKPSVDYLEIYNQTQLIKTIERTPPKKYGFGVMVGPSAGVRLDGNPYLGIGVTTGFYYRF